MALASARTASALDDRTRKAAQEAMVTHNLGGGIWDVYSESGDRYRVDVLEARCTCPDHQYRHNDCKHIRRVEMVVGLRDTPDIRLDSALRIARDDQPTDSPDQ